jgi:8-amino-7-oxononanoate synthase
VDIFDKCYAFQDAKAVREKGLYPYFRAIQENRGSTVVIDGRELVMLGSNNYLGLSYDPRVKEAAIEATRKYGTSCSGSRFLNGTIALHEELEARLARFLGKDSALVFSTGYQTNLGAISALISSGDHILIDRFNHASIMDGMFLADGLLPKGVKYVRYKHNDMVDLERKLQKLDADDPKMIVTDGVFSMEGSIVRLPEMRSLADRYKARIYLDDAHGLGVLGATGRGTEEHFGGPHRSDLIMCTFSKSFGSLGGFVAGENDVIDYIRHMARSLIFSASIPPGSTAAVLKSLEIILQEPERVRRIQEIGARMRTTFSGMGFDIGESETPIVPILVRDTERTFVFWKELFENGVYTNPVLSPAVPSDRTMLRTSFMAIHTDQELDRAAEIMQRMGRKVGVLA